MTEFLNVATFVVLVTVAAGLLQILRGPSRADRLIAVQLFGTGGCAAMLLLAFGRDSAPLIDIALTLAVLAAFAAIAFSLNVLAHGAEDGGESTDP